MKTLSLSENFNNVVNRIIFSCLFISVKLPLTNSVSSLATVSWLQVICLPDYGTICSLSGQPFIKIVTLIPGPSWTEYLLMLKISPFMIKE